MRKKDHLGNNIPSTEAASSQQRSTPTTPEMLPPCPPSPLRLSGVEVPAVQLLLTQPALATHLPFPSKNSLESL